MMDTTKFPEISEKFDLDDIRKIRDYYAMLYETMPREEYIKETNRGVARVVMDARPKRIIRLKHGKLEEITTEEFLEENK